LYTYTQEEHVADNLCRAVASDRAAFQIFCTALSLHAIV